MAESGRGWPPETRFLNARAWFVRVWSAANRFLEEEPDFRILESGSLLELERLEYPITLPLISFRESSCLWFCC